MEHVRLERVEERIAWLERHVVEQDKAVLELSDEVRRLRQELLVIRERSAGTAAAGGEEPLPHNERPPHY